MIEKTGLKNKGLIPPLNSIAIHSPCKRYIPNTHEDTKVIVLFTLTDLNETLFLKKRNTANEVTIINGDR